MEMDVKKLLWPTDFSKNAAQALPYVTSLTEKYQTEVHVLYVIDDLGHPGDPWYGDLDKSHTTKIHEWEKTKAGERLDEICENHLKGCPLYIKHIAVGDPAQEILKLVEKEKVDMVVLATHGRKGHFSFGSVAEKVVKNAPVPVVTVPIKG
jgi:nucleotide-binding universal stress UspA family protein